jgi:recombination/repair/ssDNA binding protein UvsY
MTIEQLCDQAEKDLTLHRDDLLHESLRTPELFHKYNRIFANEKLRLRKFTAEFKTLFLSRWEFYKGKATPEEYQKEQFFKKVMNSDSDKYLDGDKVLTEAKKKIEYQEELVDTISRLLKQINERQWQIRNAIEWAKFQNGVT